MPRKLLSRRAMLRGAAGGATVTVALPALEAMLGPREANADSSVLGPIFGIFFWANGMPWHDAHGAAHAGHPDLWTPGQTGFGYAPSELLAPLAGHEVSVVTGLEPKTDVPPEPPGQSDGHMRGFMVALTGDRIRPEGFDHPSHTLTALRPSLDQYVAHHPDFYGDAPPRFRSLVLGASTARFHDYGHWNAISYNGPDSLNIPVLDPGQLYDLLFSVPQDEDLLERRARVLDAVLSDAKDLRQRLGASDRQRLDEHLGHIDEVQRRLELAQIECEDPGRPQPNADLIAKTDLMAELLAIALQCNQTRVFSYMLTSPASTHVFSNLGVPDGRHKTCHDGHWQQVRDITHYHMQAFAVFLDKLAQRHDPLGFSLLDRALVFGTSEYGEGWQHSVAEMPVIFAGGANGTIARNLHIRDPQGNFSKAHVTMLRALGIPTPSFGFNGGETSDEYSDLRVG
jgi:hypothetical protein